MISSGWGVPRVDVQVMYIEGPLLVFFPLLGISLSSPASCRKIVISALIPLKRFFLFCALLPGYFGPGHDTR